MLYHNVRVMAHYLRSLDTLLVGSTAVVVWWLGVAQGFWPSQATLLPMLVFAGSLTATFLWLATLHRLYHAWRTERLGPELSALLRVLVYAAGMSCLVTDVVTRGLPGAVYGITLVATTVLLLSSRLVLRLVARRFRRAGKDLRVWLLVGRNARSERIARSILESPHFGIRLAQIVDVEGGDSANRLRVFQEEPFASVAQREVSGANALREVLEATIVDEVVVTLPLRTHYDQVRQILDLCREAGLSVKFSTDAFEQEWEKTELQHIGDVSMVTHFSGPSDASGLLLKRLIDVGVSGLALLLLAPVMGLIAVWIKFRSPGPVLFKQVRLGLHGRPFLMVKFRSMLQNADELREQLEAMNETDGVAFKIRSDPRIAPGCAILRKYHLDELPQLWNVLVGDMSLVGPRPLPPGEARGREWWQRRRLSMPPGLTCSWQVIGDHTMPFQRWMELDLAYIDGWSLLLDLRLLFQTVLMLPRGTGW
jgi:exopolysaccharide biosynthesis polyprenyl glycosylphosphotransferase